MDFSKLNGAQRIAAGGGITLLVASFLPWYSVLGFGISGWNAGALALIGIVVGVASAAITVYSAASDQELNVGSFAAPQVALIGAAVSTLFIVLRLVTAFSFVSIGLILGLVGAGAILLGTYRSVVATGLAVPFANLISNRDNE